MREEQDFNIRTKLDAIHVDVKELRSDVKDHIGRISRAEADISWLRGHVKLVTTIGITILGSLILYFLTAQV